LSGGAEHFEIAGERIGLGESRDLTLPVSQSYSGADVALPFRVWRGPRPGPAVLLTAAVHGDELNGTGILRELILEPPFELVSGTLVLVPVVNILGYERNSRYLPDRRDLNRSFPGGSTGSMARRVAHAIFQGLVMACDYLLDFHTGAVHRTNFPNVRADLDKPEVERIARAFGCALVVDGKGPEGTLRRAAVKAGRPAIILEAGEVWKMEPSVLAVGLRGVRNVLIELGMVQGKPERPAYQARIERTHWLRSDTGGLLRFHAAPGDLVEKDQPLATCTTLLGMERGVVRAPEDGIIMGLTTLPSVKPGDPVCHLALPRDGLRPIRKALAALPEESLHGRLLEDLASSVSVDEWEEE
jgi:hypothetical protein